MPAPTKEILTIVTTGLKTPSPEVAAKLIAHAEQGASIVTDDVTPGAWWRTVAKNPVKTQVDRVFYAVGRGAIAALAVDYYRMGRQTGAATSVAARVATELGSPLVRGQPGEACVLLEPGAHLI